MSTHDAKRRLRIARETIGDEAFVARFLEEHYGRFRCVECRKTLRGIDVKLSLANRAHQISSHLAHCEFALERLSDDLRELLKQAAVAGGSGSASPDFGPCDDFDFSDDHSGDAFRDVPQGGEEQKRCAPPPRDTDMRTVCWCDR